MIIAWFPVQLVDYEIFLPDDRNVTESNFYKFCINFSDCKRIKTQISPKKKHEECVSIGWTICLYTSNILLNLAIRNIKFILWFVWVTSCSNSGTIQWSPLKTLRVGESLVSGQACDFSRFFRGSSFWKLPERSHPIFTFSKSTMETPELCTRHVHS